MATLDEKIWIVPVSLKLATIGLSSFHYNNGRIRSQIYERLKHVIASKQRKILIYIFILF